MEADGLEFQGAARKRKEAGTGRKETTTGGQVTHVMITRDGPRLVLEGTTPDGGQVFLPSRRLDARLSSPVQGHFTRKDELSFDEYPGITFEYDTDPRATRVASRLAGRASRP